MHIFRCNYDFCDLLGEVLITLPLATVLLISNGRSYFCKDLLLEVYFVEETHIVPSHSL